jgi:tRNA (mo5U34)-methyltransferase
LKQISEIRWFHSIELGNEEHTISAQRTERERQREAACLDGVDLRGKSVLDVGAWDGYFSFAAKRRGAARVLATDHFCWSGEGWGSKEGFEFARSRLNVDVEDLDIDVPDLSPERLGGTFDVVLFLGVLYHLRHPLLGLERVASVCAETLVLETAIDAEWSRRPMMVFYPGRERNDDPTNWWAPNIPCAVAMLKEVGFSEVEVRKVRSGRACFIGRRGPSPKRLG